MCTIKDKLNYNPDTGEFTWKISPSRSVRAGSPAGYTTQSGQRCLRLFKKEFSRRNVAWWFIHGEWPERPIIHIDNDPDNFKASNLQMVHTPLVGEITQQYLKEVLEYDKDTGKFTWRAVVTPGSQIIGEEAGIIMNTGYVLITFGAKSYLAHRLAVLYMEGYLPLEDVDHDNRKRSDNAWDNLKVCSRSVNLRNAAMKSNNTSGITGVHWSKAADKWVASIYTDGSTKFLGLYEHKLDAANARKKAEIKYGFHANHGLPTIKT